MAPARFAESGEILFLSHRIPFPPDRGDKIRSHHVLHALAALAPVHVGTFADDPEDRASEQALGLLAQSYCLVPRVLPLPVAGVTALASGRPVSLTAFDHARLRTYIRQVLDTRPIAAIYVFSSQMGQYVPDDFSGRVVMDFVDVDSAKFDAYGENRRSLRAWIDRREGRLLRAEEARLASRADVSLLISDAEAALFRSRLPGGSLHSRVLTMGNGIDNLLFSPDACAPEVQMRSAGGPRIIFTGQMDYAPNIAAAMRAAGRVLPLVRRKLPDATLHIVGREPPAALRALHGHEGVHVWGRVPDMRPWLRGADLALVPLEIARGVQNKVLEAMAMGLPVVLTSGAATGIDAPDDHAFCIRDSDQAMADAVVSLWENSASRTEMALAARRWIATHAGWEAALAILPACLGVTGRQDDGNFSCGALDGVA
ncbi:TIGR03087 family PEP-CTERM/XrtA system glycosyltransferase [Novosphingobium sp. 9]|uniref:TIGR03087 family PEP-CTERM/XrtA system glycosyltransferase n=1 Tax=Novosphingobium sp. 9 TaxID=2025349 RepID=UPI0021B532E3|nr:TIGR03087 family PEP-CTERM/XrtA system glycosyltransferase [Novosphingobium sp. 9]